jgi:hypothetical protein
VLAVVVTWPAVPQLGRAVPGAEHTDLWNSLWSLWFVQDAVTSGTMPWHTALLGHPDGGVLLVADPINALLALPLIPLVGVAAAYALLATAHVAFSGLAAHGLAREIHGSDGAAYVAGVAYALAPVLLSGLHNGTSECIAGGWAALAVLLLVRAQRRGGVGRVAGAGVALGVCGIASWYYGVAAGLFWLALVALERTPTWKQAALRGLAVAGIALVIAAPAAWLLHQGATAPDNLVGIKDPHELDVVRRTVGAADPRGWFVPGDFRSPDFREISRYGEAFIHCHYLGWTLLVAAGIALRGRVRSLAPWVVAGALGLMLAMGPVVCVDGAAWILDRRLVVGLPWFLVERLPGLSSLSLLYRLALAPSLALAVLAAGAVAHPGRARWTPVLVGVVALELRLLSPVAALPETSDAQVAAPIHWLADAPKGAVMNFPVVGGRRFLYEQTVHGHPLTGGLNFPNGPSSRLVWAAMTRANEQGLEGAAYTREVGRVAQRQGVRYLVVHEDANARPDMHDAAVSAMLRADPVPAAEGDGVRVHKLW